MIRLIQPSLEELSFKQEMLSDEKTMSYNHAYGGTIDFSRSRWLSWYEKWIANNDYHYFYRYIYSEQLHCYVGEVAYRYDIETKRYLCDIIVHSKYRNRGFGKKGLLALCKEAKNNGIKELYDEILLDNPSIHLFLNNDFILEKQTSNVFVVKRVL